MESVARENIVNQNRIGATVSFPWGMPGLECREYSLTLLDEGPFYYLQGIESPEVGLLLINPFFIFPDYEFDFEDGVAGQLKIEDEKQVAVLCIVNTSRGVDKATANLMAPVVINTEKMLARQVVLNDRRYSLRTPLSRKGPNAGEER